MSGVLDYMKTFYIISNEQKDPDLAFARKLQLFLEEKGCTATLRENADAGEETCALPAAAGRKTGDGSGHRGKGHTDPAAVPGDAQCVLVLGGDGTLLRAARDLVDTGLPLLGINLGTLGYLAGIEAGNAEQALARVIEGRSATEERMLLHGSVYRGDRLLMEDIALNDIVIGRWGHLRAVELKVSVDGAFLCSYCADGIIASTPTGSTGYALSAGGPIISPSASLLMLTAIAPHTLNSRPVILPDDVTVTVELGDLRNYEEDGAQAVFDGADTVLLRGGDRVVIRKSSRTARLVRVYQTSFVELLRLKMN